MLAEYPECRLWFDDGTNEDGKVVANPNIGYGVYTITYANGSSREFYRIGLSANTTGISVYVLGLDDKTYLARTYGASIGKASVTGYCIKFKRLSVINADALQAAMIVGLRMTGVEVEDIGTTAKTLPEFPRMWADMLAGQATMPGAEHQEDDGSQVRTGNTTSPTSGSDRVGVPGRGPRPAPITPTPRRAWW